MQKPVFVHGRLGLPLRLMGIFSEDMLYITYLDLITFILCLKNIRTAITLRFRVFQMLGV